jgi:hypothetical protein
MKAGTNYRLFSCVAALAVAGCSAMGFGTKSAPPQQVSMASTPPPIVQNCGIVSIGSPTKYVCNGKVYTSFDLANLREDWAKNHTVER